MLVEVRKPFGTVNRAWRRGEVITRPDAEAAGLIAAGVVRRCQTPAERLAAAAAELGVGVIAPRRSEVAKACRAKGVRVITG